MPFPSVLNTFNRPATTDRLNNPSHSALHNTVSSAVGQIEQVIGRDGNNSVAGSLIYQIRSADSDGGGHVQVANKGGTGQTTFTKGDILVATSSSVLAKFAIGPSGNFLKTNSSTASGFEYVPASGKILGSASSVVVRETEGNASIFTASIVGSVLGAGNAVRTRVDWFTEQIYSGSIVARMNYGNNNVGSVQLALAGNMGIVNSVFGFFEHIFICLYLLEISYNNLSQYIH